jgi:hypothetical protein
VPEATEVPDSSPRRKLVDKCPFCGSRLLIVEGVTHYLEEAELDEAGGIHMVKFASLTQVPYHRTTWLECDENCPDSRDSSMELELFGDEEDE